MATRKWQLGLVDSDLWQQKEGWEEVKEIEKEEEEEEKEEKE